MVSSDVTIQELLELKQYMDSADFLNKFLKPATRLCNQMKVNALEVHGSNPSILADQATVADRILWLHKKVSDRIKTYEDELHTSSTQHNRRGSYQ